MPGKSLQALSHIDQRVDLLVCLIHGAKLLAHGQRFVNGNVQLHRHHLCDGITEIVGQIHYPSHIPDHAPGCQRTKSYDLHHPVFSVFSHHIINDFLAPFKAEIHVNIRHGHSFRIQETLKQQIIFDGIQLRNAQGVSHQTSCSRPPSRTNHNVIIPGISDKIPNDQEIIHIAHGPDHTQLIVQPFFQFLRHRLIPLLKSLKAKLIQVFPGSIALRHIEFRQLRYAKLDLHMAALSDLMGIFQCFHGIRKQRLHLFRRFHIVLSALIAHPVLIRQFLSRLNAQQYVVRRRILRVGVMHVIGGHQIDPKLPAHTQKLLIHRLLLWDAMILQFQEEITCTKNSLIF